MTQACNISISHNYYFGFELFVSLDASQPKVLEDRQGRPNKNNPANDRFYASWFLSFEVLSIFCCFVADRLLFC